MPAAGFKFLSRLYDPLVRITCRETYFKKRMIETAEIKPGQQILDVGCGTGTLLMQIHSQNGSVDLHGLDGDPEILNMARHKAEAASADVNWIQAYSTEIPLANNSLDLVTNSLMIHHLIPDDKIKTFNEIHRVMKPGGRLVLADWGKPSNLLYRILFKFIRILDGHKNTLDHLNGKIPVMIQSAGFEQVKITENIDTIFGTLDLVTAQKPTH